MYMTVTKILPVEYNIDDNFTATASVPTRAIYLYLSLMAARPKYYFAWTLAAILEPPPISKVQLCCAGKMGQNKADAINNAAGFGFQGYDKNGTPCWDLISNLRISHIEFSTSFKMFIDNWNIQTALWLKRVCYERATFSPTAQTFLLSAIWHGVYPGYYLTFFTGIFMTQAARSIRNNIRHLFLKSPNIKLVYDIITWVATQIAISYTVVPFVLLSVKLSFRFYSTWYYCLHIICILVLLVLPSQRRQKHNGKTESIQTPWPKEMESEVNLSGQNSLSTTNNNCNQMRETVFRHKTLQQ